MMWVNQLVGTIPSQLGQLTALTGLYVVRPPATGHRVSRRPTRRLVRRPKHPRSSAPPYSTTSGIPARPFARPPRATRKRARPSALRLTHVASGLLLGGRFRACHRSWVGTNSLVGTVPTELGELTALIVLCAAPHRCYLPPSLPPPSTACARLTQPSLVHSPPRRLAASPARLCCSSNQLNQLNGTIPTELGDLTRLNPLYAAPHTPLLHSRCLSRQSLRASLGSWPSAPPLSRACVDDAMCVHPLACVDSSRASASSALLASARVRPGRRLVHRCSRTAKRLVLR